MHFVYYLYQEETNLTYLPRSTLAKIMALNLSPSHKGLSVSYLKD